jgi:hypothetical protein
MTLLFQRWERLGHDKDKDMYKIVATSKPKDGFPMIVTRRTRPWTKLGKRPKVGSPRMLMNWTGSWPLKLWKNKEYLDIIIRIISWHICIDKHTNMVTHAMSWIIMRDEKTWKVMNNVWILSSTKLWLESILNGIPPLFMFTFVSISFVVPCYYWLVLLDF